MGGKDKETYGQRMILRKGILEGNKITQRFSHFLPVYSYHVVVNPVSDKRCFICGLALRNFTLVMREDVFESPAVDIQCLSQVFHGHSRAFEVPSWESFSPGAFPPHDVSWFCLFPEGKICRVSFFRIDFDSCASLEFLLFSAGKFSIFGKFLDIEIYGTI